MKHLDEFVNEDMLWDEYYLDNIELYEGKRWNKIKQWFKKLFVVKKKDKSYSGYGRYHGLSNFSDYSTSRSSVSISPSKSTSNYDKINDKGVISSGKLQVCINNTSEVREAFFAKLNEADITHKKGFYKLRKRLMEDNEIQRADKKYFYGYTVLSISKDQIPFVSMFVIEEDKKYYNLIAFELEHTIDDSKLIDLGKQSLDAIAQYCNDHGSYVIYNFDRKYLDETADFMKRVLTAAKFMRNSGSEDHILYYK